MTATKAQILDKIKEDFPKKTELYQSYSFRRRKTDILSFNGVPYGTLAENKSL